MGFDPNTKHKTTTTVLGPIELGKYALLRDEKSSGTQGGTFTSGAWRTRDLNTEAVDAIGITLSSNQFTLPAGTYRFSASAPARIVNGHKIRLQNITDVSTVLFGEVAFTSAASDASNTRSRMEGQFTIAASKTFEIQHRCATTRGADGFGSADGAIGDIEVYASIELVKVA